MDRLLFALAVLTAAFAVSADDLPPSCIKRVYCNSKLLHHIQTAGLYPDSKTFVDKPLKYDEETTLAAFDELLNQTDDKPSNDQLKTFVADFFSDESELETWTPSDYMSDPTFLKGIRDQDLRQFAKNINAIWPTLGKKVKEDVIANPDFYSFIPVTHGIIIPGGRFTELYYWDTYWIIEGLLISEMRATVKGVIENLIELLNKIGHIPNGSRWYYQERSQPPLLTAMVSLYYRFTKDREFLKANIGAIEKELQYWMDTQIVTFEKDGRTYTLLRYNAPSAGPRPESYNEDYTTAQYFQTKETQQEFYTQIKSAAESGWDFSSRWFSSGNGNNTGNLTTVRTTDMIPVDLNSIFANALQTTAYFHAVLRQPRKAAHMAYLSKQWRASIKDVLWNEEDGIWYDYDIGQNKPRKYFYPSNVAPLWMGVVEKRWVKKNGHRVLKYLKESTGLDFPGGIPTSLVPSHEQWDFPNAWPPLVSVVVNALEAIDSAESKELAFHVAQTWVRSCYQGFVESKQMFEKYDVESPGKVGGGGEYTVQTGFGWSNGVILEFLAKYGRRVTKDDSVAQRLLSTEPTAESAISVTSGAGAPDASAPDAGESKESSVSESSQER